LAAALSAAAAMVWRRRRNRYHPGPLDSVELADVDLIPLPGTITAARQALREQVPQFLDPSPDVQPTVAAYAADKYSLPLPSPGPSGPELAGLADLTHDNGLGLTGLGAEAAARALLVATLSTGSPDDPEAKGRVIIPADTLTTLLGAHALDIRPIPRLIVTTNLPDALTILEEILIERRRTLDDHAAITDDDAPAPYPPLLPPVLLLAETPPAEHRDRLATTMSLGSTVRISTVILGVWTPSDTLRVDAGGFLTEIGSGTEEPTDKELGTRQIATLDVATTVDLLQLLREAHTGEPSTDALAPAQGGRGRVIECDVEPTLASDIIPVSADVEVTQASVRKTQPTEAHKVSIRLLGQPTILDKNGEPVPGLRLHARELLVHSPCIATVSTCPTSWRSSGRTPPSAARRNACPPKSRTYAAAFARQPTTRTFRE
jgi:hypothetical protein